MTATKQEQIVLSNRDLAGPNFSEEVIVLNERVKKLKTQLDNFEISLKQMEKKYSVPKFQVSKLSEPLQWCITGGGIAWVISLLIAGLCKVAGSPTATILMAVFVLTGSFTLWTLLLLGIGRMFSWHK